MPRLPLDSKCLELAEGGVLAGRGTVFGDQGCNIHAQVTKGCVEEEAVDGLVEASAKEKGGQDEENAEEREDGCDSFCNHHGIDLAGGGFDGHDGQLLAEVCRVR